MEVDGGIRCISVCSDDHPEDEWVAVGMQRGKIILFKVIHLFENLEFATFEDTHKDQVWDIKFISRGEHVSLMLSVSLDGVIAVTDMDQRLVLYTL